MDPLVNDVILFLFQDIRKVQLNYLQNMSTVLRRPSELSLNHITTSPDQPGHSILLNGPRSTTSASGSYSPSLSASSYVSGPVSESCAKIRFAPLPQVPPELKRSSSISLGVAARKHLLSNQAQQTGKSGAVYMNDADWQIYKKQYQADYGYVSFFPTPSRLDY